MSTSTQAMGGRLPVYAPSTLTKRQRALYDRLGAEVVPWAERAGFVARTEDGRFIGPFNPSLLSPEIAQAFWDFQVAEEQDTTLDDRVRQVVILAVGAVWQSPYELYAHSAAAHAAGLARRAITSIGAGGMPEELSPAERSAYRFTHQLTADRRVEQAVYDEAHDAFGHQGLVDILYLIGAYQAVCGLLNAFEIPAPCGDDQ